MDAHPEYATASDLRYILSVMEERSHLGLDNESAIKIRNVLGRRIADAENASVQRSTIPAALAVEEAELLAR